MPGEPVPKPPPVEIGTAKPAEPAAIRTKNLTAINGLEREAAKIGPYSRVFGDGDHKMAIISEPDITIRKRAGQEQGDINFLVVTQDNGFKTMHFKGAFGVNVDQVEATLNSAKPITEPSSPQDAVGTLYQLLRGENTFDPQTSGSFKKGEHTEVRLTVDEVTYVFSDRVFEQGAVTWEGADDVKMRITDVRKPFLERTQAVHTEADAQALAATRATLSNGESVGSDGEMSLAKLAQEQDVVIESAEPLPAQDESPKLKREREQVSGNLEERIIHLIRAGKLEGIVIGDDPPIIDSKKPRGKAKNDERKTPETKVVILRKPTTRALHDKYNENKVMGRDATYVVVHGNEVYHLTFNEHNWPDAFKDGIRALWGKYIQTPIDVTPDNVPTIMRARTEAKGSLLGKDREVFQSGMTKDPSNRAVLHLPNPRYRPPEKKDPNPPPATIQFTEGALVRFSADPKDKNKYMEIQLRKQTDPLVTARIMEQNIANPEDAEGIIPDEISPLRPNEEARQEAKNLLAAARAARSTRELNVPQKVETERNMRAVIDRLEKDFREVDPFTDRAGSYNKYDSKTGHTSTVELKNRRWVSFGIGDRRGVLFLDPHMQRFETNGKQGVCLQFQVVTKDGIGAINFEGDFSTLTNDQIIAGLRSGTIPNTHTQDRALDYYSIFNKARNFIQKVESTDPYNLQHLFYDAKYQALQERKWDYSNPVYPKDWDEVVINNKGGINTRWREKPEDWVGGGNAWMELQPYHATLVDGQNVVDTLEDSLTKALRFSTDIQTQHIIST